MPEIAIVDGARAVFVSYGKINLNINPPCITLSLLKTPRECGFHLRATSIEGR